MGTPVTQHSFRGEISPEFYGNTRNPLHGVSLRTCKNFLPIVHGALVNRPGFLMRGSLASSAVRFKAFVFTSAQAFILELSAGKARFWTADGLVLSGGVPYEVATVYTAADLPYLKFVQEGDVVTIARAPYAPQDLTRITSANWTFGATSLSPPAAFGTVRVGKTHSIVGTIDWDIGGAVSTSAIYDAAQTYARGAFVLFLVVGVAHLYQSKLDGNLGNQPNMSAVFWDDLFWVAGRTFSKGDYTWFAAGASDGQIYISLVDNNINIAPVVGASWALASDTTRVPAEWQWSATWDFVDTLGRTGETLPCTATPAVGAVLTTDRFARLEVNDSAVPAGYTVTGRNLYRGRKGLFGLRTSIGPTETLFVDEGGAPDYGNQPPAGTNPFAISGGTSYPAVVFYDNAQRRGFARSDAKPQTFLASRLGHFDQFDRPFPLLDEDAYEWKLANEMLQEIRSVVQFGRLCIFTGQTVFTAQGVEGKGITANNVQAIDHNLPGSSWLDPIRAATTLLYNTEKGSYVREFYFDYNANAFVGSDITEYARHLFEGYTILSWAFQEKPYGVLWIVRSDGRLFSCTFDREKQVIAWAQHPTYGQCLQVACIPNGTEDALFLGIIRNGDARMEVLATRAMPKVANGIDEETGLTKYRDDLRFAVFLDAALQFDERNTDGTLEMTVTGVYTGGGEVTVLASRASFAAGDVGDRIVIDPDSAEPTSIEITVYTDPTHVTGILSAPLPAALQATPTSNWGWARNTITGLSHLEGLEVTALADAFVQGPFTVAGGQITLTTPACIVTVGLSYNSDAELLDLAADAVKPNVKSVSRVVLDVVGSQGILAGETFEPPDDDFDAETDLMPAKLRSVTDDFSPAELFTGQVEVPIGSTWNTGGRACIRQSDPLPLTITSVTRDVEVGGRGG